MGMNARTGAGRPGASIRTLWGLARSPELKLSEEDLHALVYRETGKESIRQLTQGELNAMARVLSNMKDSVQGRAPGKRTDEGGNARTERQRRKIYTLCDALGWNNDPTRINGFIKKMCRVERLEWLTAAQCEKVIEALKAMAARQAAGGK